MNTISVVLILLILINTLTNYYWLKNVQFSTKRLLLVLFANLILLLKNPLFILAKRPKDHPPNSLTDSPPSIQIGPLVQADFKSPNERPHYNI